jgi:hypothetical protein
MGEAKFLQYNLLIYGNILENLKVGLKRFVKIKTEIKGIQAWE